MRLKFASLLSTSLILTACGGGDSAIDGARNMPNRFGNTVNALDDFSPGSTGDSSNARGLEPNEVRVTMEVPVSFAPSAEATRRNLRIVIPDQIQVYRTNNSLQKLEDIDYTTATGDDGHFIVGFKNGLPIGPDVVIEATWNGGGGITMKALAADSDRDVKVNPFSHYVVEETLGNYDASEFQTVMNCVNDAGGGLCLNKYVWSTLADQVHDFEIEIGSNANLDTALARLKARADFAAYVNNLASYALLDESSSGSISASAADYNSVFFGLELGQSFRDAATENAGQWGVRTAQEQDLTGNGDAFLYPALTLTSFNAFGLNVTSLATDIPYDRQTITHTANNSFTTQAWERNSHSSSPGAATLTPDASVEGSARLLAGRALYQSITDQGSSQINGWTRNPYYLDAFTTEPENDQTGPDRVLASYFTAGKAIELQDEGGKLKRRGTLENHFLSAFELHLLRSESFDLTSVQGDYNLVYLAASFGGTDPVAFETGSGTLNAGSPAGNELTATVATTSFAMNRADNGSINLPPPTLTSESFRIANRLSRLSVGNRFMGRLSLCRTCPDTDFRKPDVGQGAATPDGSLVAFNLDDSYLGDGLMIAGETHSSSLPENGQYRVQGVIIGMDSDSNELLQVNNGLLQLTGATAATLTAPTFQISHTVSDSRVSAPVGATLSESFSYAATGGAVTLTGSELVLKGFYTADADQLFLVLEDDSPTTPRTGLLMATLIPADENANP